MNASQPNARPTWSNPVWHGRWRIFHSHGFFHDFAFCHDDYDGADDANDSRFGHAKTIKEARDLIDEIENAAQESIRG